MRPQVAVTVQCVPVKPLQHKEVVPRRLPGCPDRGGGRTTPSPTRQRNVSADKVATNSPVRSRSLPDESDEALICEPVTRSSVAECGTHSEPLSGMRSKSPSPSSAKSTTAAELLRRKTLLKKQAQSSPLLLPPRMGQVNSRSSSVETANSAESRAKTTPRSPACAVTSPSGTDDEHCPSMAGSNGSLETSRARRRSSGDISEVNEDIPRAWGTVERTFKAFCGIKPGMDGKTFAKLCKDANMVDKSLTKTDVDLIFAKVVQKGGRRIGLEHFDAALELIAEKKGMRLEDVWSHVRCCGGPVLTSTKAETVRFYDDKSTYTGTHAQGGPDPGRKGRGTGLTWSATTPSSAGVPNSPRDFETIMSLPGLPSALTSVGSIDDGRRGTGRVGSLSEKKIAQQLRGKDGTVEDTFRAYCANKPDLDGKSFVKLCKDCEIVDDVFTQIDADLIFAKVVSRGHRRITLHQFELALRMMAQKKGVEEDEIFRRVAESEGVLHAGTQADYVRFFDDKSTYTGTHLYGGPDNTQRSSFDQLWSSDLRPDNATDDRLPDMVVTKIAEISPTAGGGGRAERPAAPKAQPRARLAITAKSKPPQGKSDDFTMVFTDVQGSTSLWEANPRAMEMALRLHDATIRQVLAKHSGYEVTTEGDAFQIAFHDTCDAVAFCLDTQAELLRCEWPAATLQHPDAAARSDGAWRGLRVRMGLHSGRPASVTKHEVTGRTRYAGPSVAMAKAIEGVCHGGQIIMSASSFYLIDGLLTLLGTPQVVDLGEHILEGHGLTEDASRTGCAGRAKVQLIQLVPDALAHAYSCEDQEDPSSFTGGRLFPPIDSEQRVLPGFVESPAGPSITLCFVFTQGARELVATDPMLANQSLGLLRGYLRDVLRNAGDGSGYECQEDEGAFMLAFANMLDAAVFSILLQRKLPHLQWPEGLKMRGPNTARGLRVSIGALSGGYTSKRPHASTGRADYFGTIVNRTARIAAAAHPGQVLLGGDTPIDPAPTSRLPGLQWQQPPALPGYPQMVPQPTLASQPAMPQPPVATAAAPSLLYPGITGWKVGQPGQPVQHPMVQPQGAPVPGRPVAAPGSLPNAPAGAPGWSLQRLGAFALKGIDSPIVLTELRLFDEGGNFESFPDPKTKGRVSA